MVAYNGINNEIPVSILHPTILPVLLKNYVSHSPQPPFGSIPATQNFSEPNLKCFLLYKGFTDFEIISLLILPSYWHFLSLIKYLASSTLHYDNLHRYFVSLPPIDCYLLEGTESSSPDIFGSRRIIL